MSKHRNAENQSAQSYERQLRFGSMLRKLLPSGSRRWITPIVMLLLLLGIVAGAVIVSSVTQRHVQLDDGTVWVTSLKDRKAARFNVRNRDADAGVASTAARFDVAQHDGSTVISEGTKASNIEASTVSESGNTTIKSDMRTVVGGNTAAFINVKTGNVWVGSADDVKSMNPTTDSPKMKLGSGGRIAVTHDGVVYGYRASDGAVLSVDGPQGTPGKDATIKGATNVESFTVVGKAPVVAGAGKVFWPKGSADIGLQGQATLQAPSTDGRQTGWVAVSTPRGIAMVDLGSKKVTQLPNAGKGDAAQPVSTNGCVFAAWAQKANNYIRVCAANDKDAQFSSLEDVNPTSQLVFRTNHRLVVLNDVVNGNVWNPQESTKVIKIQWNKVETKQSKQQQQNNDSANNQHNFSKNCSAQSGQIKAVDDSFGARVGSQQILDVLRNDEQTDCSVLRITSVSAPDGANITVSPVYDGRYLQLDASGAAAGNVSFSYEISDGRGQTSSATVSLTLAGGDDHAPLQSDTPPEIDVEQGASYTANALGSFSDPDGDPLTLVSASPQNTDQVTVSTRADGQLVFNAGSMSSGRAGIEVTVSDGQQTGTRHDLLLRETGEHAGRGHRPRGQTDHARHPHHHRAQTVRARHVRRTGRIDRGGDAVRRGHHHERHRHVDHIHRLQSRHLLCAVHHHAGFHSVDRSGSCGGAGGGRRRRQADRGERCGAARRGQYRDCGAACQRRRPDGRRAVGDQRHRGRAKRHQNRCGEQQARLYHRASGADRAGADLLHRGQRGRIVDRRHRPAAAGADHVEFRAQGREHHHTGAHRRHRFRGRARPCHVFRRHHGEPAERFAV